MGFAYCALLQLGRFAAKFGHKSGVPFMLDTILASVLMSVGAVEGAGLWTAFKCCDMHVAGYNCDTGTCCQYVLEP